MRFLKLSFFLLSALFIFASCEKDNFDVLEEIEDPTTPVIIEEEEEPTFLKYLLPNGESVTTPGRAVLADDGFIALSTAEEGSIECTDGVISIANESTGLVIILSTRSSIDSLVFALGTSVDGLAEQFVQSSPDCETTSSTVDITSLTDENVAGTVMAEFFAPDLSNPTATDCDLLVSTGVFEISFNLPLTVCD